MRWWGGLGLALGGVACAKDDPGTSPSVSATEVAISPAVVTLAQGAATPLSALVTGSSGEAISGAAVTWWSDAPSIATVTASGRSATVTAVAPGTTRIRAAVGRIEGTSQVTVSPPPVARVTLALAVRFLLRGDSATATAVTSDANGVSLPGRRITWSTVDSTVATVSDMGVVRAVRRGATHLVAASEGQRDSVPLGVLGVRAVAALPTISSTRPGTTVTLRADVAADSGVPTDVRWRSLDPAVASVSIDGTVSALVHGRAALEVRSVFDSTFGDTAIVMVNACLPQSLTLGVPVTDRYESTDCNGRDDVFQYTVTAHDVLQFTLSGTFANALLPVDTLWGSGGTLRPTERSRYTAVPPGTYSVRVVRRDSSSLGAAYTLSTSVLGRFPDCVSGDVVRGAQFTAVLLPTCSTYSYQGVTDRPGLFFRFMSAPGRQVKVTVTAPDFPVYVELRPGAFAQGLAAGQSVSVASPAQAVSAAYNLLIASPVAGAAGKVRVVIDP